MKKNDYLCPECKGHLNAGGYVIFSTKNKRNKRGLILLSPKVGSYTCKHHDEYRFEPGEMIEFYCPVCLADLKARENPNLVSILMIDENDMEYKVMFSRKAGEQSTYVIASDDIEIFGNDAIDLDIDEIYGDNEYL